MTLENLKAELRTVDPGVVLIPHPTIPCAVRCVPSHERYLGELITTLEPNRTIGLLVTYTHHVAEYHCAVSFGAELEDELT